MKASSKGYPPIESHDNALLPAFPQYNGSNFKSILGFYLSHLFHAVVFYHCVKSVAWSQDYQDMTSALAFYGVYHRTPYNQLIHFFGVPLIIWTMLIFGAHLPFSDPLILETPEIVPWLSVPRHRVTWSTLWVALYTWFYLSMDVTGACCYIPILYVMYATSVRWTAQDQQQLAASISKKTETATMTHNWYGTGRLLWHAFLVHIFSWYIQIHPGHAVLEGATPASLVNLGAALTAAPLFAFYEGLWYLGLRRALQQQVLEQVAIYTQQLCQEGADLRVCTSI
jgi:2-hydroxy fatty acid dioxygenase